MSANPSEFVCDVVVRSETYRCTWLGLADVVALRVRGLEFTELGKLLLSLEATSRLALLLARTTFSTRCRGGAPTVGRSSYLRWLLRSTRRPGRRDRHAPADLPLAMRSRNAGFGTEQRRRDGPRSTARSIAEVRSRCAVLLWGAHRLGRLSGVRFVCFAALVAIVPSRSREGTR